MKSRQELYARWTKPNPVNLPSRYANKARNPRSRLMVSVCTQAGLDPDDSIMELGCNVGRNLYAFHQHGYKNLYGIEINPKAVELMRREYPGMDARVMVGTIEEYLKRSEDVDLIFTVAVLMHLHPESEWIFEEMATKSRRFVATIEDEARHNKDFHISRNYYKIFTDLGMECIHTESQVPGMTGSYVMRLFQWG